MFKKYFSAPSPFFTTAIKLFALQFILLSIFRLCFYLVFKSTAGPTVDDNDIHWAFIMGLQFDLVASTYALLLPVFLLVLNGFFYRQTLVFYRLAFISTLLIFWLYALVSAADFPYFKQFGSHLNKQAFLWVESPHFVIRLIFGNLAYYGYLILFLVLAVVIHLIIRKIYRKHLVVTSERQPKAVKTSLYGLLLVPLLIGGARGRLSDKSTTHEGLAIVSDNLFVNQIALNPNFTFFRSLLFQKVKKYEQPERIGEYLKAAKEYLGAGASEENSIARQEKADSLFCPYNVVIVCMESMNNYKMGMHGRPVLTPHFNEIVRQSVFFDRFFSSGIHTFNGLSATCSGFPAMLIDQGLRRYTKRPFTTLGNLLLDKGYDTYFLATHDPHFDNMAGFFKLNGFQNILSSFDLPAEKAISATGVPDHEIFNLFIDKMNNRGDAKPFLGFIMTGSDHGPWAVPHDIPFKPTAEREQDRSTQYADWALGEFMKDAKKQAWYNNTLFVFLGDHGSQNEGTYEMPLSYHHVPFVLHQPNIFHPDTIHHLGYQPDVTATIAGALNLSYVNNSFGNNILKHRHPFVFFTADDKLGCVSDDGYFFYELINQKTKRLRKFEELDQKDYYQTHRHKADSLEQSTKALLHAAEYFIRRDYFSY
jgi:phosphoglycerol transferase MdoB-like AlkP superfamily enzyme